ncbi:hypothetical protein HD806DRAFT_527615 [Xylariaceae sp. AK1471]|nr:hypothetical protein HD806DRAFT_527615 [Xylariaceae sp. AK1471]
MANAGILGEDKVSKEAAEEARKLKKYFEKANEKSFNIDRIIEQGSWGVTLLITMRSSNELVSSPGLQSLDSLSPYTYPFSLRPDLLYQALGSLTLSPVPQLSRSLDYTPRASGPPAPALSSRRQENTSGEPVTRFVLKRSLTKGGEGNVTREIDALNRLRGSMHIAQPSGILNNPRWNRAIASLEGPALVMDWIENGLLWTFYERRCELDEPLPNRMLWCFFLCLCRMVVGMAWPLGDIGGGNADGSPVLEVIPPLNARGERPAKSRLLHGDFHARNIMIDKLEPVEHKLVPVLKLIDFGMSRDLPVRASEQPDLVVKSNILAAGEVMLGLLRGNRRGGPGLMEITHNGETKQVNSYAPDLDKMSAKYGAPPAVVAKHQERIDNLDPDIRSLVALCVALKVEDRPNINNLLLEVERNAKNKTPDDYTGYKYYANESDVAIKRLVEDFIFNA